MEHLEIDKKSSRINLTPSTEATENNPAEKKTDVFSK